MWNRKRHRSDGNNLDSINDCQYQLKIENSVHRNDQDRAKYCFLLSGGTVVAEVSTEATLPLVFFADETSLITVEITVVCG